MRLAQVLTDSSRVALDASALIDYLEEDPLDIAALRPFFERFADGRLVGCGSVILRTEVLVYAAAQSDMADPLPAYRAMLERLDLAPVTDAIADLSVEMRLAYRLDSMDALHLASAAESGCDTFLTADDDFKRVGAVLTTSGGHSVRMVDVRKVTR